MNITIRIEDGATITVEGDSAEELLDFLRGMFDDADLMNPNLSVSRNDVQVKMENDKEVRILT